MRTHRSRVAAGVAAAAASLALAALNPRAALAVGPVSVPFDDVRYEELVADPEPIVRGMLEHIGVPFDERCLAFHESSRAIHTASLDQVRRPIYTSSTERWRRYGPGTGPLIDALTRHGVIRG